MFRHLELERLEERLAPTAAVAFTSNSVTLSLSSSSETASVNISGGYYTVTDTAGFGTVSGGTASGSVYTSSFLASGQTAFTISSGSVGLVSLAAPLTAVTSVTVGDGTLQQAVPNALPATANVTIGDSNGDSPLLDLNNNDLTIASLTYIAPNNYGVTSTTLGSGNLTLTGNLTVADDGVAAGNAYGPTITGTGNLDLGGNISTWTVHGQNNGGYDLYINCPVTDGGILFYGVPSSTVLDSTGVQLQSADSFSSLAVNEGNVQVTVPGALPTGCVLSMGGTTAVNGATATLDLDGNTASVEGISDGPGAISADNVITDSSGGGATLTDTNSLANYSFSGQIQSTVSFVEAGTTTQTLAGVSSYSGATTVSSGNLNVTGTLPSASAITLSGGTLGGTGTVGAVTLAGGTIDPGLGATAILNTGALTFSGGTYNVALNGVGAGTSYDQLDVTGGINLSAASLTGTLGYVPSNGDGFTIIHNVSNTPITGTFNGLPQGSTVTIGGYAFTISYTGGSGGNDVTLTYGTITPAYSESLDSLGNLIITQNALSPSANDALGMSYNGTTYTFSDAFKTFDVPTGANAGSISGAGTTSITIPGTAVSTITITLGTGANSFDILGATAPASPLSANIGTTSGDVISVTGAFQDSGAIALTANTIALSAGTIVTTAGQTYTGAVTLGSADTLVDTAGGNITLGSTVNGAQSLTLSTSGATTFGVVGGTTALTSLTVAPGSSTTLNGNVTTTGSQLYNSPILLGATSSLTSTASGNITFVSTVDGAHALTVTSAGVTTFVGVVGGVTPLTSLTTGSTGSTTLAGGAITTTGVQTYGNPVTIGGSTVTNGSNVTFSSTVNCPPAGYALSTPTYNWTDISTTGTPTTPADDQSTDNVPLGFTFSYYGANYTTCSVDPNGYLTLPSAASAAYDPYALPSAYAPSGTIAGWWTDLYPINSANGTVVYQTLGTPGNLVFIAQWTSVSHYPYTSTPAPATFEIELLQATGQILVELQTPATQNVLNNEVGIENPAGTQGMSAYYGVAALPNNTAYEFSPATSGSLTVNATGATTFGGAVGNVSPVTALTVNTATMTAGAIATATGVVVNDSGAASITGVISGSAVTLTKQGAGTLTLGGTNTFGGGTTVSAGTLVVNGVIGAVTVNAGTLTGTGTTGAVTDNATISVGSSILNTGALSFGSGGIFSVALNGTVAGTSYGLLDVTGGMNLTGATLQGTLGYTPVYGDSYIIINNVSNTPITGTFTGLAQGSTITIGGVAFTISYTAGTGGDSVSLTDGVAPAAYSESLNSAGNLVITQNTLSPSFNDNLTLTLAGGNYMFTEAIRNFAVPTGANASSISGGGTNIITIPSSAVTSISITLGTGANTFTFAGTNGASAAPLTANIGTTAGDVTNLTGAILDSGALSLTSNSIVDAAAASVGATSVAFTAPTISLSSSISSSAGQTYTGAVTLGAASTLTDSAASAISFSSTINGAAALTVTTTGGSVTLGGAIGGTTPVTSLTVNSATLSPGAIASSGAVTINDSGAASITGVISGAGSLVKQGAGTLTPGVANTYNGVTTVSGGILSVGADSSLGATPASATAGKLVLNGGTLFASTSFILNSFRGIKVGPTSGTGTGEIDVAAGQTLTYGGIATNNGGTGTLIVGSGTNTGTLVLNGVNTFSALTLATGKLGGTGTVGALTDNATVQPGLGTGTSILTTSGLSFGSTGIYAPTLAGTTAGTSYDQLDVTGPINLTGATLQATIATSYTPALGDVLTIIKNVANTPITGAFVGMPAGSLVTIGGLSFQISYLGNGGNDVTLTRTNVISTYAENVDASGNLTIIQPVASANSQLTLTLSTGTYTLTDANGLLFGYATGAGAANVVGGGTSTITFPSSAVNSITITQGTGTNLFTIGSSDAPLAPLTANAGSTVGDAVNISAAVIDNGALTLTGTTITDTAAGTLASTSLTLTGSIALNSGSVTTTGNEVYAGPVVLGAITSLTSSGTSNNITFNSTLDGAYDLTVSAGGTISFNGVVGGITPLNSVTTGSTGTTALDSASVTTTAAQTYNNPVVLGANTVTNGSNVDFTSTVTSPGATTQTYTLSSAAYNWTDISGTGTAATFSNYDDGSMAFTLPFTFNYYGTPVTSGYICTNGFVQLGSASGATNYYPYSAPSTNDPADFVGAWFTDLWAYGQGYAGVGGSGTIYYQTVGTAPNQEFIVEYDNVGYYSSSYGSPETFEMDFYQGSNNIYFEYQSIMASASTHVVGLQNATGTNAVTVAGENATTTTLNTGTTAYLFTPQSPQYNFGLTVNTPGAATFGGTVTANYLTVNAPTTTAQTVTTTNNVTVNDSGASSIGGVITGASLIKQGLGTLTVVGASTLPVTISAGVLDVTGSVGDVTINGGELGGSGTAGNVTDNAIINPGLGTTTSILTTSNLAFGTGSVYTVDVNGPASPGSSYDQLVVNGTINLTGATLSMNLGYTPVFGDTYTIISNPTNQPITGTFNGLAQGATVALAGLPFTISYTANAGNDVTLTSTNNVTTATALTVSPLTANLGQPVDLTATVTIPGGAGGPAGTVNFYDGATLLNPTPVSVNINSGVATFVTSSLSIGAHSITADYLGDGSNPPDYLTSNSSAVSVTINQDSTVTTVGTSQTGPFSTTTLFTFTATVASTPVTTVSAGTVTFYAGPGLTNPIGAPVSVTGGSAVSVATTLPAGSDTITAVYSGATNYSGSQGTTTVSVNGLSTTTTLTDNGPNPSNSGQNVNFTGTVSGGVPTGDTVSLEDASNSNAVVATTTTGTGGSFAFNVTSLSVGSHNLFAVFAGDATYATSQSSQVTQVVNSSAPAPTVSSIVVNGDPSDNLAGTHSRVATLYVTFSAAVQLGSGAFTLALHNNVNVNGTTGQQVGAIPATLHWSSPDNIHWTVTFSGANTNVDADGHVTILDGVYDLTVVATQVHPLGVPGVNMASNFTQTFWALFGDTGASDSITSGTIGNGLTTIGVGNGDFNAFANAYQATGYNVGNGYDPRLDVDGDGSIGNVDFNAFANNYQTIWTF